MIWRNKAGFIWGILLGAGSLTVATAQDCLDLCDSLDVSILLASSNDCDVQLEVDFGLNSGLDSVQSFIWTLDGSVVGNSSALLLSSESVQSAAWVSIEITTINSSCTCSYIENVAELMSGYNWPCACQPFGPPVADFNFSGTENCGGDVQFINASSGAGLSYEWSFGAASEFGNSNEVNPLMNFSISGGGMANVQVALSVTDEFGCTDVHTEILTILETPNPWFSSANSLCTGGGSWPVNYNLYNPNPLFFVQNELSSLIIDWGNGDIDSLLEMSIPFSTQYNGYGYYPITFTAWGLNGCSQEASDILFVGNNPEIGSANPGNTTGLCAPESLTFPINNFASNDPATLYTVDFGDGTTAVYNHPPPTTVTHEYTTSSCGANEGAVDNAYVFTVSASNECSSSYASVAPIQVILTEEPSISGPTLLCEDAWGVFAVSGGYSNPINPDCSGMESSGVWSISPLSGQGNPTPASGIGSEVSASFGEPGLYLIAYEDYEWMQDLAPCTYDAADSLELCVMSLPGTVTIASNASVNCVPAAVELTADLDAPICGSYLYNWNVQGGAFEWSLGSGPGHASPQINFLESGIYLVELTVSIPGSSNCFVESNVLTVAIGNNPDVVLGADVEICEFDEWNATVFVNPGNAVISEFQWTLNGEVVQAGFPSPYAAAYDQAGTFELVAMASNACGSDADTLLVEVQPLPLVEILHDFNFVCEGATVEFTAIGADSYSWTSGAELLSGGTGSSSAVYLNQGGVSGGVVGTIEYDVVTCSSNAGFAINTFFVPGINISGETQGCAGDTLQLNAQITNFGWPVSVQWLQEGELIGSGLQLAYPTGTNTESPFEIQGVITFDPHPVFLQPGGCHDTAFASIQVFPLPDVQAPQSLMFCDQPIAEELPAGVPENGDWSGPGVENNTFTPSVAGLGDFALVYGFADGNGCFASDTSWVEVSETIWIAAGLDSVLCESNDVAVISSIDFMENAYWTGPSLLDEFMGTVDLGELELGENEWIYHSGVGSCAITDTVVWTILESPIAFLSTDGALQCDGDTVWFDLYAGGGTLSPEGSYEFIWSENVDLDENGVPYWISDIDYSFTLVMVEIIDEAGCSDLSSAFITPVPLPQITMPSDVVTCLADFEFILPDPSPANGVWTGPGIIDSEGVFNPALVGLGNAELTYSVVGSTGCLNSDNLQMEVIASPAMDAGNDLAVCPGSGAIALTGFLPEEGGWWEGPGIADEFSPMWDSGSLDPGIYTIYYHHGAETCPLIDSLHIEIRPLPSVSIQVESNEVCWGDSVFWTANAFGGTASSSEDYQIEWAASGMNLESNGFTALGLATEAGEISVAVNASDALGCTATSIESITVHALPEFSLPDTLGACVQDLPEALPAVWLEGGTWSGPGVDDLNALFLPYSVGMGAWTLHYEAMDENGCWGLDSLVMNVQEPVAFDLGSALDVCIQSEWVDLPEPEGLNGGWFGDFLLDETNGIVDADSWSAGSYAYIFQVGQASCAVQDSLMIEVHSLPEIEWESNALVCLDSLLTMSVNVAAATDSIAIDWTLNGMEFVDAGNSIEASWSEVGFQEVTAMVIDGWGCSATSSFVIEVPALPFVFAGNDLLVCDQPIAEVIALFEPELMGPQGNGVFYGIGTAPGAIENSGVIHPQDLGIGIHQAVYAYTDSYSGCVNRDTVEIQVVAPSIVQVGVDIAACGNEGPIDLEELSAGSPAVWSSISAVSSAIWLDSINGVLDVSVLDPGEYAFELSAGMGSCLSSDSMVVTILPVPNVEVSGFDAFCFGQENAELTLASPAGGMWMGTGILDADAGTFDASLSPDEFELSYVFVDDVTGCADTAWQQVSILSLPQVNAGLDLVICNEPIPFQLEEPSPTFNELGTGYFMGLNSAATAVSEDGWVDPSALALGSHSVVYIYTESSTGCMNSDTLNMEVNASFGIVAGPDTTVCANAGLLILQGQNATSGVTWTSTSTEGASAIADDQLGIIDVSSLPPGTYDFVISTGAGTCEVTDSRTVFVLDLPEIELIGESAFCANEGLVYLPSPSPDGGIWLGNGIVDATLGTFVMDPAVSEEMVAYAFTDPTTLCTDTAMHAVVAWEVPMSDFTSPSLNCTGVPVILEQTSAGAVAFEWWLNGVLISNVEEPLLVQEESGWFDLSLVAVNSFGCQDTSSAALEWIDAPTAAFTVSDEEGCAPLTVETDDDSSGDYAEWTWFVDGAAVEAFEAASITFSSGADVELHEIELTVENACGNSQFATEITVLPVPQMAFSFLEDSVCSPYTANILNTSLGNPDQLNWDFGNGETASGWNPPMPTYSVDENPAWFEVTLSGANACGADSVQGLIWVEPNTTVAFFNLSTQSGCAPLTVAAWDLSVEGTTMTFDFGNGYFASDSLASTTYLTPGVYEVTQMITNGCSYDTISVEVEVFAQPQVMLTSDESELCVGEEGEFEADATNVGQIAWDFGDGFETGAMTESNVWNASGFHWVTVEVSSALNACLVQDSLLIHVLDLPVIDAMASSTQGCAPLAVEFINESAGVLFWQWNFDDGGVGSVEAAPLHEFLNPTSEMGEHVVTVTGINADGCSATQEITIQTLPAPAAAFALEDSVGCGTEITVEPLNGSEMTLSHSWTIDGVLASTAWNPLLNIVGLGSHELGLEVENMFGCTSFTTQAFTLHAYPEAGLNVFPAEGCGPLDVEIGVEEAGSVESMLLITSEGSVVYDGPAVSTWTLTNPDAYEFQLFTTSVEGCQSSFAMPEEVHVWPRPLVQFIADPYAGTWTSPDPLNSSWTFENYSEEGQAFWDFGDGGNSTEWDGTHSYQAAGVYEVTLTVFNEFGCPAEFSNLVVVKEHLEVYVPNAFTPPTDGFSDGINDGWKPVISDVSLVDQYDLFIYNRNGQLIWHSEDPEEYWIGEATPDGQYFGMNEVYTWVLQIDSQALSGSSREWRGHVTLIR